MKQIILALVFLLGVIGVALAQSQTATLTVKWTDTNSNEDGTIIERRLGQSGPFEVVGKVGANETAFVEAFPNDPGNTQYCYRAAAFNSGGNSPYSNIACATTPQIIVPPASAPAGINVQVEVRVTIGP